MSRDPPSIRHTTPHGSHPMQRNVGKGKTMNKLPMVATFVLLLAAAPALAQAVHQTEMVTLGRITAVDLQRGTLALDTGMQFTLAPSLQYTTTPAINQEVQVTYSEQGGQKIARILDLAPRNINKR